MTSLSPRTQALLMQFSQQPGVTPAQAANLQIVLNSSPQLIDQLNTAVSAGHMQKFELLPAGTNAGGTYDPSTKAIALSATMLTAQPGHPLQKGEPVFVIGHELQHALNRLDTQRAYDQSRREMEAEARKPSESHDYTSAIQRRIGQNRRDESLAEIAGFNALVGFVRSTNPNATVGDVYAANVARMKDFIDINAGPSFSLKPNLTPNPDLTLSPSSANIEAMGTNYFDKSSVLTNIGHHGNSDYVNYYAASAISLAVQSENAYAKPYGGVEPRMIIDMQRLGLSEKLLEENGLFLGRGHPAPKTYYDSGRTPHAQHRFDHTHRSHAHVPVAPSTDGANDARCTPSDPRHPDHALLEQIRGHVRGLDRAQGREHDLRSEQLSHSLLTLAREHGLARIDHVVLGAQTATLKPAENIFVVEGRMDDLAHRRAVMKTGVAAQTPVAESNRQLDAVNERQAQEQSRVGAQPHQQQVVHDSPAMRM